MNYSTIIILSFLFSFETQIIENISMTNPQAISIDLNNNIYIADTGNNRILKFNENGKFVKSVGGLGWEKEQFDSPVDICAKSALDIFIADYNNQRIERYDKDLNYISSYYSDDLKSASLQFGYPRAVSISIHGELVLIDAENSRLLKINSFGEPEISFGDFAEGAGKLENPVQIDISREDEIYVSDTISKRIVVYDYFGNYLKEIGKDILNEPLGIYYDLKKRLWVADRENNTIFVFLSTGDLIYKLELNQVKNLNLKNPVDIAVTDKRVYILTDDAISVFEIKEAP